jgi:hypothetical protein
MNNKGLDGYRQVLFYGNAMGHRTIEPTAIGKGSPTCNRAKVEILVRLKR